MPTYLVLYKFTDQGAATIKDLPQRVREAKQRAEQFGVKVQSWYLTQGQYDAATIVEAADEETVVAGVLAVASRGNVRSETLRAYDESEMARIIQKLP